MLSLNGNVKIKFLSAAVALCSLSCKQAFTDNNLSDDQSTAKKKFVFTLQTQDNRFSIANVSVDAKPAVVADVALNFVELKSGNKATITNLTDAYVSEEPEFNLSLFYRPDFQLCLPKTAVKVGANSEGDCVAFRSSCEVNAWGVFNDGANPSCSCKTKTITVGDFRATTDFTPVCDKDRRDGGGTPAKETAAQKFKRLCENDKAVFDGANSANPTCKCSEKNVVAFDAVSDKDGVNDTNFLRKCMGVAIAACKEVADAKVTEDGSGCACGKVEPLKFIDFYEVEYFQAENFKQNCTDNKSK